MSRMIGVLLLLPIAAFAVEGFSGLAAPSFRGEAWGNTLLVGSGAALAAVVLGIPVGLVLAHARRHLFLALSVVPLLVPPALAAAAWLMLPLPAPGPGISALLLGSVFWPIVALILRASLSRLPRPALDAAVLHLPPFATYRLVVWPHVRPALATAALLVFLLAASDFTVPATFAVTTVSTEIYRHLSEFQFGRASWTALPLLLLGGALALLLRQIPLLAQSGEARPVLEPGLLGLAWVGAGVAWLLTVVLPVILFAAKLDSLRTFLRIVTFNLPSIAWSAAVAGISALLLVGWASLAPGRSRMEPLWLLALVVPGVVTALGTLVLANRLEVHHLVAPTGALFVIALMARFAYAAWLPLREPVARRQLEAAELAGLSRARTWRKIVWPELRPRAIAVAAVVFILCLGEIGPAVLLNPPGPQAVTQHLFNGLHYRELETVSSLSLFLFATAALVAWGGMHVGRFRRAPVGR